LKGKIRKGIGGFYYVAAEDGNEYECKARGVFRNKKVKPLVGDDCEIEVIDKEKLIGNITSIFSRKSECIRPAVANVDQAVLIVAAYLPEPHTGLLDRFLVNMETEEIPTIVCINKCDIAECSEDSAAMEKARKNIEEVSTLYRNAGYEVLLISAQSGYGMQELKERLMGKTTVLSGPSGVGKSSVLQKLVPSLSVETGELSEKIGRGKNTTRHSELIRIKEISEDTFLMDTPGFSSVELIDTEPDNLKIYFKEMRKLNETCRFTGCQHVNEPDCKVKAAVENGVIAESRYKSYKDLFLDLKSRRKYK